MARENRDKSGLSEQQLIRDLATLLDETGLSEIEIERSGLKVRVARSPDLGTGAAAPSSPRAPAPATVQPAHHAQSDSAPDPHHHPGAVKSPMVGTVYLAPEPNAPPFVEVGARVEEGQTVLIIEAMKTMNHIPAPRSGAVRQILVENGHPVEFAEPLLIIE